MRHLHRQLSNHQLIEADAFALGLSFQSGVQRHRQAHDKLATFLRRHAFDESGAFLHLVNEFANGLVFGVTS